MRIVTCLAMMAALVTASPAFAQKTKPEVRPLTDVAAEEKTVSDKVLPMVVPADPENTWLLDLSSGGRVAIRLRPDAAPLMVERIKTLTRQHFYDGTIFHRVNDAPEGMAQGGDPSGNGTGGSELPDVPAEFTRLPHVRGAVSAARTQDPNSANSQFFIMFSPRLGFDENYTVFGRVVSGMQWVDAIARGEPPPRPTKILRAYIESDNPPPYQAPAATVLPAGEKEVVLPGTKPKQ